MEGVPIALNRHYMHTTITLHISYFYHAINITEYKEIEILKIILLYE